MYPNKLRFYWFSLLFMGLLWGTLGLGCQCSPGVINEYPGKETTGGGNSTVDGPLYDGSGNGQNDGNSNNRGDRNSNNLGDGNSNNLGDGNGNNQGDGNGNNQGDGNSNNLGDGNGNNQGDGNGNRDGGTQWPPGGPDDRGHCGQGRVINVPSSQCATTKQVCVQKQYVCSPKVELRDGRFVIDGQPTFLRGVVYNPIPKCKPYNYDFTDQPTTYKRDFPVLKTMGDGIVLRMVRPVSSRAFLDEAHLQSLRLIIGFAIKWQQDFAKTCPQLRTLWRAQLKFYQHHPAIVAYAIGDQTALHILNSGLANKEQRLKSWYQCLNLLAGEVKKVEGIHHRPVSTVSGAHPNERIGDPTVGADETSLSNIDFHLFQVFFDVQVGSWLRSAQRKKLKKPVVIGSYGVDACHYQASTKQCQVDQISQGQAMLTLARDAQAAFENPLATRAAGGIAAAYSDDLWAGDPASDLCGQNATGYPHGYFPDGFFNLEWFGLVDIHSNPQQVQERTAFKSLSSLWNKTSPWPSSGTRNIKILSHKNGDVVSQQFLVSGTFSNFQKKMGEDWAGFFILIRPYRSADHYPMVPISLCCGFGPQEWMMALQVGRKQDVGKQFELVPAYTTSKAVYEQIIQTPFFITKPAGLTILKNQVVLVTRK